MEISKKIIEIRKNSNMTQQQFAEHLFVTRQTISNW
ncbi:helix-turn-helix transcriptional regulator [Vagococcus hydrophili]|uniref:Helix-turn-helix transcriptional regulator n=1 Tax=Vagococcus hydrophili TaxID=2714947 RepID=A0A6G8ATC0_9ENTE|nr:helix-turn-helix transcriptional regulator [Vagococcus hydrophili]QIL48185.1 helix-turn-helix transcriptional regulator [Vagococcus hydrophili]